MKKQLIRFVVLFLICIWMPLGATAANLVMSGSPWPIKPGGRLTFTVTVQEDGSAASGKSVTFSITSGDGNASLGATSTTTGSNGRASTSVTLGDSASGSYTVTATVGSKSTSGTATVNTPPPVLSLSVISGPGSGVPGDALTFTVEVQEDGSAAPGKTVTFSITSGDGNASLGTTSTTTGSNGRASTSVTLGDSASGSYTITASSGSKSTSGTATVNTPPPPPPVLSISVISGPGSGDPGDSLTFTVEVQEDGSAASGKTVTFSITSGDGNASLGTTSTTTGSNGRASTSVTLGGSASGSYTITASVGSKSTSGTATVNTPPPPSGLAAIMFSTPWPLDPGDSTTFSIGVDEDGSDAPGKTVTFSVSPADGTVSLSATSATTDSKGQASTTLRTGSGSSGSYTVTASVGTLSVSSSVTVNTPPPPLAFWIISGDKQQGLLGEALANPFVVEVRGQSGDPLPGVQVTFSVSSGGGTLSATITTTDNNGRVKSTLTLGPNPGTNTVTVSVTGIQEEQTITAIAEPPPIPQDVNRDDMVNILDLVLVASVLGDEGGDLAADVNGDGVVNILDLVLVAGAFGNAAAPSIDPRAITMLTATDVGRWLAQAGEFGLVDTTAQRGVLFLEQLLAALTPKETALLPNYPNPFNPETWIPYGLANGMNVQISIYDISGELVRQLDLGHQRAGHYTERSRAAYWDGRNGIGEHVASGVYFYTLTAGDFTATRKMLIGK